MKSIRRFDEPMYVDGAGSVECKSCNPHAAIKSWKFPSSNVEFASSIRTTQWPVFCKSMIVVCRSVKNRRRGFRDV